MELVYCSKCGAKNDDNALRCINCGEPFRRNGLNRLRRRKSDDIAELSWRLRRTLARVRPKETKWLNRILDQDVTDDEKRAEIFRYIIERVEYSVDNPTVPTGIEELDDVLYGGIPKGYAVIITSPPLDEKDLLIENFLLQGVYSKDVVLQICTRMKGCARELIEKSSENFFLILCNPWTNNIIRDQPNVINLKGVEDLTQLSISLDVFLRGLEEKGESLDRVVLNIVSDALLTHETRVVRRWLMDLLTIFKHRSVTSISTLDPEMHSKDEARTIIDLFDGHVDISERKVNDEFRKVLTVKRLYNKKYLEQDLFLRRENMTPEKPSFT